MNEIQQFPQWQSRTALLFGDDGMRRIASAHVLCVGLGGVGGIAAEMICRAGVGSMTIVDGDIIEATNVNRQLPALHSTVGKAKTEVLAQRLLDINPELKLTVLQEFLKEERIGEVLDQSHFDCVLDAIDTLSPKLFLVLKCLERKIPVISCLGSGAKRNPEGIVLTDISKTQNCPLARALRKRLKKHGVERGVPVIYSPELPVRSAIQSVDDSENKRSITGTVSYIPAAFGCHCASAVIETLLSNLPQA